MSWIRYGEYGGGTWQPMNLRQNTRTGLLRQHFWGIVLLIVMLIVSTVVVRMWKVRHPGSMSVIESQAMVMTAMKPPVGAVPVATEVVHAGGFDAKVTYTGSVAPMQEQIIYPRVEGWLKDLMVYNGSKVGRGQLLAVVDSPDLRSKAAEASAGHVAALTEVPAARYGVDEAAAQASAAEGQVAASKSDAERSRAMAAAVGRAVTQAEKDVASA